MKALEDAQTSTETEEPEGTLYPEFVVGNWYYAGNKISFSGNNYICVAPENVVCVWSPIDYPEYWEIIL